ncbi:Aquaporin-1 [Hyphodiscus hymeniophilus]|uniref:Aquaporin-1 n=1 Tax=Hyphodiscus hymeniophilus TaxID=353542 RepID=A0A9P6VGR3_9HELO|nr:Aquaporin-1 [Hyphodiscus hymeniophilus]
MVSPTLPGDEVKVCHTENAAGADGPRVGERWPLDRNQVSLKDYNDPVGGRSSSHDHVDSQTVNSVASTAWPNRREPRRQLRKKRDHATPKVRWAKFMSSDTKNHMVAVLGEFIGTTMFLFFAFAGTQVANIGTGSAGEFNPATLLYISLCFGFSLMVNAWVFFRISGGLFNPAVTLALTLTKALSPLRGLFLSVSQISGACFAAYLVSVLFPTPFNVQTTLGGGTSLAQGVFIEALCTAELVFTIIMLAKEKHRGTFIAPIGIGLALFIGELVAVYYTGGSLNPARSFGPAAVARKFRSNHWIYWVGPLLGSLLATAAYVLFKALEYEMANPGQDGDEENDPTVNPGHEIAQAAEERQAEVEEMRGVKEDGGSDVLATGKSSGTPSVLGREGVVGMAVERGEGEGDEQHVVRSRSRDWDLEAQSPTGRNRWGMISRS